MIETVHTNNQGAFQPDNNSVKTRNKCNLKFGSSKFNAIYKSLYLLLIERKFTFCTALDFDSNFFCYFFFSARNLIVTLLLTAQIY